MYHECYLSSEASIPGGTGLNLSCAVYQTTSSINHKINKKQRTSMFNLKEKLTCVKIPNLLPRNNS